MLLLGKDEKAKYPFMPDAGRHLQEYGFELSQFGADPALGTIVKKAYERVMVATRGLIYKSDLVDGKVTQDHILDMEIFSFLLSIVLIKLTRRHTLIQRFALSEARRAEEYLTKDLSNESEKSKGKMTRRILYELFNLNVEKTKYKCLIPVSDYLKHSAVFHEREWKLVNRQVQNGFVVLNPDKVVRLLRHALTSYITSRIVNSPTPDMIPGLEEMVSELMAEADRLTPKYKSTGEYPPCIKHAITVLENGENLSHSGRFMLATFLLTRNQTIEQIAPLFKNAPDYNEKVTMYQLNYLSGQSGTFTKYTCPSCNKLRTQDLCFATPQCDGIISPLQFGRKKQ